MSAGAYKADLLTDLRGAVDKAITQGVSLGKFRQDFDSIVATHGWSYNGSRDWRSELIYSTNIRTSYAAGRWSQLTDSEQLQVLPYLTYKHGDSRVPRPLHLTWNGLTLPADDPWWQTHYPPNGWGCKCRVFGSTKKEYEAASAAGKTTPLDDGYYTPTDKEGKPLIDPTTGKVEQIPKGIDRGWDYNVGEARNQPYSILQTALDRYPEDIRRQFIDEMAHDTTRQGAFSTFVARYEKMEKTKGDVAEIGWFDNSVLDFLKGKGVVPELPIIIANDKQIRHLRRTVKEGKGTALTLEEAKRIPLYIAAPEKVLYDTEAGSVLYVAPSETDGRANKMVIEVNYTLKKAGTVNLMVTAGKVQEGNLSGDRYVEIPRNKK